MYTKLTQDEITRFSSTILFVITALIFIWQASMRVDYFLKIKAVDDCAKISKYQKVVAEDKTTFTYPVLDIYKQCLRDKGVK